MCADEDIPWYLDLGLSFPPETSTGWCVCVHRTQQNMRDGWIFSTHATEDTADDVAYICGRAYRWPGWSVWPEAEARRRFT